MSKTIQRKKVIGGIRLFLILTVLGITFLFYSRGSAETWAVIKDFRLPYLLVAGLLISVDLFSGAARIHIFTRRIIPRGYWVCFKANLANIFLAAATPFQTGGGIAQLYVLHRHGVPYGAGVTVSVLNFVATLSLLLVAALMAVNILPTTLPQNQSLLTVMDISRFAFYVTFILFVFFMLSPRFCGRLVDRLLALLSRLMPRHQERFARWNAKISGFLVQYRRFLNLYWRKAKGTLLLNYLLTIVLYFNKCLIAYVILLGLGIPAGLWEVVLLQMLIIFFLYFAPTPGASFLAEAGIAAVMTVIIPTHSIPIFAVLWRFFTTYFGVLLGSLVLLRMLARPDGSDAPRAAG
jgi:hypothetical protein